MTDQGKCGVSIQPSIIQGPPLKEELGLGALTLPEFLREVTERFPDHEALVHDLPDGTIERCSYSELWQRSLDVARALVACGLGKGERVGILITNRPEFLHAIFGTALAGGVAAPLSTFSTAPELEHLITLSACSVLLLERAVLKKDFAQMLCEIEPAVGTSDPGELASFRFPFLRHLAMVDSDNPCGAIETWSSFVARGGVISRDRIEARIATIAPSDPGVLFFSSGSTAKPKGILSAHRGVAIQMWRMRRQQDLHPAIRYWTANGFFWSGNFAMALGATLAAGGTLVLQRVFHPEEALNLMERERVNFLFAWPHQWEQLVSAENWHRVDLSALTHVDVESPIARHPTITTKWIEPRHAYGNTETFTLSVAFPASTSREEGGDSHGVPLPGNILKIVDPLSGETVPIGESGEIAIKGPTLMLGYIGTPLDETLDEQGYFHTGDGGYIDELGRLVWHGRLNDIIKTGGANVSPVEIDSVLRDCPGIRFVQTVGMPHATLGELVVTCIVKQANQTLDEMAVRQFAKGRLASYKIPRRVLFFDETELQLTGSAKIKTVDLRRLVGERLNGTDN